MKKKPVGKKIYIIFVLVAILALVLSHPSWLPFPETVRASIREAERTNLILNKSANATVAQLVTLALSLCIVWLAYQVLRLILKLIGKRGSRTYTITEMLAGVLKYVAVIVALVC